MKFSRVLALLAKERRQLFRDPFNIVVGIAVVPCAGCAPYLLISSLVKNQFVASQLAIVVTLFGSYFPLSTLIFRPGASPLGLVNFTVFPSATLPSMISFASGVSISF